MKFVQTMFLVIIFAFIFVFSVFIFQKIFFEKNIDYISSGLSAFMGAFFAFLFLRIAQWLDSLYVQRKEHFETLIKLEQLCNEYLGIVIENKVQIEDWIKALESKTRWGNRLQKFPRDREICLKLKDFNLLNDTFRLDMEARRLNESIEIVFNRYKEVEVDFRNKLMSLETFSKNISILLPRIKELLSFHDILDNQTKKVLAQTRILQGTDKPLFRFFKDRRLPKPLIEREKKKIEQELTASQVKSAIEIISALEKIKNDKKT